MKKTFIFIPFRFVLRHGAVVLLFVVAMSPSIVLYAQQTPVLSHYYYNSYLINPALAGQLKETQAFLHYRQQWVGIPGSPQTQVLTIDGPLEADSPVGLGLNINNDESDILTRSSAMLTASYAIKLAQDHELDFGMSIGIIRNKLNFDKIRADLSDPAILNNSESKTTFEGNAGLSYRYKKFRLGFVSEQLFNKKLTYENAADFREISYVLVRHYMLSLQHNFILNQNLDLTPMLVMRSAQGLAAQFDINAMLKYQDIVWTNIAYRHQTGVGLSLGVKVSERFIIGYNYEIPTTDLRYTTSGSHEFMLGMKFTGSGHRAPSQRVVNNKVMDEYKRDTNAQYEKLDELQQRNESMSQQLLEYKKVIEQQNSEIEKLKKSVVTVDDELKSTIDRLKVDLQNEGTFDKASGYYLVIGAVRTFSDAKAFQKIIRRETKLKAEIIQNDNQTWYFIYSHELQSAGEAKKRFKELEDNNIKPYIIGNPWVYKTTKTKN
jgi:type IX secretion system PorP/SprF family membrane protein